MELDKNFGYFMESQFYWRAQISRKGSFTLDQLNLDHSGTPYFYSIHFNNIPPIIPSLPSDLFMSSYWNVFLISFISGVCVCVCVCVFHQIRPTSFAHSNLYGEEWKL
jgi:hypothetical protein